MFKTEELFDLSHTAAAQFLSGFEYPYEALPHIKDFIKSLIMTLSEDEFYSPSEGVMISKKATVAPTACINGPAVIFEGAEIRHCAYIRGAVLVGKNCVVGNSTELKNCILFDKTAVPHFNYVGDSILGYCSHLGAGAVISNVKSDKTNIVVREGDTRIETGLRKFGAMVGDFVEVGCNSVLNPGTVIGRNSTVYPGSRVRGVIPEDCICKSGKNVIIKKINK
mgnify:CR=1 FL=1